ncbi:MAG: DNA-binding transcriptional repressor PuuR [Pelotomaculum sp. PtaB.Bin013]|uniref:XRE family transcriptional regulator n=1 Tax=Pelotomaculum isophthalicicum JI TaxID=947010 RepID=A0A9X4H326_9FIRM|nr:XRE family transcriptional regulator [Pelotomaculum isophthalicicum]MDF9408806.1 XRE family transcriptional regulator [Pelotomaculum isophthalicicum JI]OPX81597.1 MAG: DNA-binding transcriptional repressor PuuR [Pelotomaculum sp. PtaB.Bin013]
MDQKIIGANLRRIREAKGWTQSQVADLAGISRVAYRNIENCNSIPKVSTLQNIASGVGVKLQDLLVPVRTLKKVRFRASKKMNSRDNILIEIGRWLDDFNYLEKLLDDRKDYRFKALTRKLSSMDRGDDRAKYAAEQARRIIRLKENEPIRDIAGLLESCGIKVYPLILVSDGFFGLSVAKEDGGPAVIVNVWERISVERWIFSAAHELGHLLLHLDTYDIEESAEDEDQENEANVFASHFLMPEKAFKSEWDDTYGLSFVDRVLKVKRIFQVSYKTVLYRLSESMGNSIWGKFQSAYKQRSGKTLSIKDEPEALSPDKFQQSPEVLRSQEPDSLSPSHFVEDRLSRLVRKAIEKDEITMSRGAEILRFDLETMRDIVSSWV